MATKIFVNLPVKDLTKSKKFFTDLGFEFKDSPANLLSLLVGKQNVAVNLFKEDEFKGFSGNESSNVNSVTEVLFNFRAANKAEVNEFAVRAKKAGGAIYRGPEEKDGWMYGCGITDLDGHRWCMLYMDKSKMPKS